jgi:hypothetical protein
MFRPKASRQLPTRFHLMRYADANGVSGTGVVAEGVVFSSGQAVLKWLRPPYAMGVYDSVFDLLAVHGHDGQTVLEWLDVNLDLIRCKPDTS